MLILLIRPHCKICTLPTIQTREITYICIVGNGQISQWDLLMSKINIFAELRQKVRLYIHDLVHLRCLPSLDVKHELFVTKKRKKRSANLWPDRGNTGSTSILKTTGNCCVVSCLLVDNDVVMSENAEHIINLPLCSEAWMKCIEWFQLSDSIFF